MASMRDIKRRRSSIASTQQITNAMKLVSTVKLQKTKARAERSKPYFDKMYATVTSMLAKSGTIVWNGPVGVFEFDQFAGGTKTVAEAIANSRAFSIAGGGDTLAAIAKYNIADKMGYISTGGGAFLEFLEGKTLPAVEILMQRAQ